jgi:deoxycytidylate deaminase
MGNNYSHPCSCHAEMDAINKLKPREKKKRLYEVNMMVIRVNNSGKLCSSQPCHLCVDYMKTVAVDKGYKIKHIYYSTSDASIERKLL